MERVPEKQPPSVITSDTENATAIYPSDAPPAQRAKYEKFRAYNTGLWNGPKRENKAAIRRQDNLHRYDAIASQAGLTPFQKERGRELLDSLNIRELGLPVDHIAFALCVIVANADVPDGTRYWPHPDGKGDKEFERLADSLDLSVRQQISAVMKLKYRTGL